MRRLILVALLAIVAGCAAPERADAREPEPEPIAHAQRVVLHTSAGDITLELAREQAPVAVEHFVALARSGVYEGTRFHRAWQGELLQGGDPNSRNDERATWGYGGAEPTIAPELNPMLRHDAPGAFALASATGGTQFYVTLRARPDLDDRFPVLGRVAGGMDVVERIASAPNVGDALDGQPIAPVVIERVSVGEPDVSVVEHAFSVVALATTDLPGLGGERTVERGEAATFALAIRNIGNVRSNVTLSAQHAEGWRVAFERERVELAAQMSTVVLVEVEPPIDPANEVVNVVAKTEGKDPWAGNWPLVVRVADLGEAPRAGDRVRVEYVLVTADGRLVDATRERFDRANVLPTLRALGPRASYAPHEFALGDGSVLPAFDALVARLRVGEAAIARVPAAEGYQDELLRGRDLVFEARLVEIVR